MKEKLSKLFQKRRFRMRKKFFLTIMISMMFSTSGFAAREAYIAYEDVNGPWEDNCADYLKNKLEDWDYDDADVRAHGDNDWGAWADSFWASGGWDDTSNGSISGVDNYDIGFVYAHGVHQCPSSGNDYWSRINMGDDRLYLARTRNEVLWGDDDLNYVIMYSCQTVQLCVFENYGYLWVATGTVEPTDFGMMMGFHGDTYNDEPGYNNFKDFVSDSKNDDLGDNWVDNMTDLKSGSNNDVCATAVVWAEDESDADRIYEESGFLDYETADKGMMYFYGWEGCDPLHGEEL